MPYCNNVLINIGLGNGLLHAQLQAITQPMGICQLDFKEERSIKF